MALFKDKNSKFLGFAFPIQTDTEIKGILDSLRKAHPGAVHVCWAAQWGTQTVFQRANDDGEPAHTAGTPLLGQLVSFNLTQTLLAVVRYYGGVKLGVSGLINAYKTAGKEVLNGAQIIEKQLETTFEILSDYPNMSKALRFIKEKNLRLIEQQLEEECRWVVAVRKSRTEEMEAALQAAYGLRFTTQ
ncbi:MAG: YigZ family protein [Flavobacterium sp. BFFFF2]|nr:MAG: YigZ family protein [Flavobacterium sp. BFFFF2]